MLGGDLGARSRISERLRWLFAESIVRVQPSRLVGERLVGFEGVEAATVLALGKCAYGLARGGREAGCRPGLLVTPHHEPDAAGFEVVQAAHPHPDASSIAAGERVLEFVASSPEPLLVLLSGGTSSLVCVPALGLSLEAKRDAVATAMAAGAPIQELNSLRKHLSGIKGGRLAEHAKGGVTTLAISDVVGDTLSAIGSGPTVADPSTYVDVIAAARNGGYWHRLPRQVRIVLAEGCAGKRPETPKTLGPQVRAEVLASYRAALVAAQDIARQHRWPIRVLAEPLVGSVQAAADRLRAALPTEGLLLAAGEPTVELPECPRRSGRAHHLALLMARDMPSGTTALVGGTDGVDGTSGATGAVVDSSTWERLHDPDKALATADAASALASVGASFDLGPTGVNHADLILAWGQPAN